jgi:hypothetical protein
VGEIVAMTQAEIEAAMRAFKQMRVGDLIDALSRFPPDMVVQRGDADDGNVTIRTVELKPGWGRDKDDIVLVD